MKNCISSISICETSTDYCELNPIGGSTRRNLPVEMKIVNVLRREPFKKWRVSGEEPDGRESLDCSRSEV